MYIYIYIHYYMIYKGLCLWSAAAFCAAASLLHSGFQGHTAPEDRETKNKHTEQIKL